VRKFFLLRHCEANQNEENIDDLEKKLSANGNRDAILIKKWFLSNNLNLDKVYTSSATRAVESTNLIFDKQKEKVEELNSLYLCNRNDIIELLRSSNDDTFDIALVGHEPSVSETLRFLVGTTRPDLVNISKLSFPPGGMGILYFNIKRWSEIEENIAILDAFITPRYLAENEKKN
tara:strand:- start:842 stop:1369 length:528 start_codon:yes stop_codon:yes gene_type:complete